MDTNWIRISKKFIFIFFLTVVLPFLLFILAELLLYTLYKITESKYFENKIETNIRNDTKEGFEIYKYDDELPFNNVIKVSDSFEKMEALTKELESVPPENVYFIYLSN